MQMVLFIVLVTASASASSLSLTAQLQANGTNSPPYSLIGNKTLLHNASITQGTASATFSDEDNWNYMALDVTANSPGVSDGAKSQSTGTAMDVFHVLSASPGSVLQISSEYNFSAHAAATTSNQLQIS